MIKIPGTHLSVIILLAIISTACFPMKKVSYGNPQPQFIKDAVPEIIITDNYRNNDFMQGAKGTMYHIDSIGDTRSVLVTWDNGYYTIGKMRDSIKIDSGMYFDKKNRLRICDFGNGSATIKFDKRGRVVSYYMTSPEF